MKTGNWEEDKDKMYSLRREGATGNGVGAKDCVKEIKKRPDLKRNKVGSLEARSHPTKLPPVKRKVLRNHLDLKHQQIKNYLNVTQRRGTGSISSVQPAWRQWLCDFGSRVTGVRRLWNLPLWLKKVTKDRCVSGESLHGSLEGPFCELQQ